MSDYKLLYNNSTGQVYLKRIPSVNTEWFSPPYMIQKPVLPPSFHSNKNPITIPTQISKVERESTIQSWNNKSKTEDIDSKIEDLIALALPSQNVENSISKTKEQIIELDAKTFFEKYPVSKDLLGAGRTTDLNQIPIKKPSTFDPSKYFPKEKPIIIPEKPIITVHEKPIITVPEKPIIFPEKTKDYSTKIKNLFDNAQNMGLNKSEPDDFLYTNKKLSELKEDNSKKKEELFNNDKNIFKQQFETKKSYKEQETCTDFVQEEKSNNYEMIQKTVHENIIYNVPIRNGSYGIKKVMFNDLNQQGFSKISPHFNIGLNRKSISRELLKKPVFDTFYLAPGMMEVKNKYEINLVNEKRIEVFRNKEKSKDIQHFPMDFVPNGIMFPLRDSHNSFDKISIKQIYWSIHQNLDALSKLGEINSSEVVNSNSIYGLVPNGEEFILKNVSLQLHVEIHAPLQPFADKNYFANYDLYPYEELIYRKDGDNSHSSGNPSSTCIFPVKTFEMKTINDGFYFPIDFNFPPDFSTASGLACAMICFRISVHPDSFDSLRVKNMYGSQEVYGTIPFSQIVLDMEFTN